MWTPLPAAKTLFNEINDPALYSVPCVSMAKVVFTVLFANATAAHYLPRRSINALSLSSFGLLASHLTT